MLGLQRAASMEAHAPTLVRLTQTFVLEQMNETPGLWLCSQVLHVNTRFYSTLLMKGHFPVVLCQKFLSLYSGGLVPPDYLAVTSHLSCSIFIFFSNLNL